MMNVAAARASAKMKVIQTGVGGVLILEPKVFGDARGFFLETYNEAIMAEIGITERFVQDNHSKSLQNVLRGLHYQVIQPQGKLVRAIAGEIFDVAVDICRSSPTFGKWAAARLSADNKRMMWVPPRCAHGFLVVSESAEVVYKATDFYAPEHERSICWDDPDLGIKWPIEGTPLLSEKDRNGMKFADCNP